MKATHKDWILFNGRMINTKEEQPMVALEERGFQFGDGIYEVFRLYDGKPHLLDLHLERFFNSMAEIKLIPPFTKEELVEELHQMIEKNQFQEDGNVYLQISRGAQPRNHVYESDLQPTYFANLVSFPRPVASMEAGIKVTVEEDIRWKFCHIKSLNLLPNIMIKNKINEQGYQEAILVRDGIVTEGCHSNFFIVKNNKLITHPANHLILHGITRHYAITLAKELHIEVEEREFSLQEVYEADECFFTATPLEIFPVVQIGDEQFGAGERGPITKKLQVAYEESIRLFKVTN
ncbi:D-amino-acid transaminase [Bacillus cereus BAG1X2-3]|uniref:D-alanine aminotransferase n=1 Tax=Bacillus cereus TaxID=1396 RepID=A0A9X7E0J9_BACCE|nr:D-amino-acid transaminase [Bacillus cereus]EOO27336.1 D-amino-acid transaminase [Bacillus cereus BAG1X1-1]EOO49540.1 D-amino-acid transaminase [Bacillus cereus BAG1X2-1]EOO51454.1 D-amino-acid transaminase [Bacillus cereus BAG1X2-2]EOO60210.1 D-amino-acid transaminase [Bacillus cereus BAG1X2-3]EOP06459.1 D-amino-acid transaminase [Bacillus cereus BAG2O-1]